jgi:hypothetical protein
MSPLKNLRRSLVVPKSCCLDWPPEPAAVGFCKGQLRAAGSTGLEGGLVRPDCQFSNAIIFQCVLRAVCRIDGRRKREIRRSLVRARKRVLKRQE